MILALPPFRKKCIKLPKIKMALFTSKYLKIVMNFWSAPNALIFNLDVCFLLNDTLDKKPMFQKRSRWAKDWKPLLRKTRNVHPATNWPPSVPTSSSQPCSSMPPVAWPRLVITGCTLRSVFHPISFVLRFPHKDPHVHAGIELYPGPAWPTDTTSPRIWLQPYWGWGWQLRGAGKSCRLEEPFHKSLKSSLRLEI